MAREAINYRLFMTPVNSRRCGRSVGTTNWYYLRNSRPYRLSPRDIFAYIRAVPAQLAVLIAAEVTCPLQATTRRVRGRTSKFAKIESAWSSRSSSRRRFLVMLVRFWIEAETLERQSLANHNLQRSGAISSRTNTV